MEIGKLETVVRSLMGLGAAQPGLLAIAGAGGVGDLLSQEFTQAARTLAAREAQRGVKSSTLRSRLEWI